MKMIKAHSNNVGLPKGKLKICFRHKILNIDIPEKNKIIASSWLKIYEDTLCNDNYRG